MIMGEHRMNLGLSSRIVRTITAAAAESVAPVSGQADFFDFRLRFFSR